MKLSAYIEQLNKLLEERPNLGDMLVVSSKDDEGNGFNLVTYAPSPGFYHNNDREFKNEEVASDPVNAVCIN